MNSKLILVLKMMATFDDYGNSLNFTKDNIENFIKKYKILETTQKPDCNERGIIMLFKKGYITSEQFGKFMDIEFDNKTFYIVCDSFGDVLDKEYNTAIEILDGTMEWNHGEMYDYDVSSYWDDYTEETLKKIIEYCIKNKYEIDGKLMTNKNTKIKNKDIYFKNTKLVDLIDEEYLEGLKNELNYSINEAQESAEIQNWYDRTEKSFEENIGEFKWKEFKDHDGKYFRKLYVEIDESIDKIDELLKKEYAEYDFESENYGDMISILREMNYFDGFREPDYDNSYGSIDDEYLNELTRDRLSWSL